MAMQKMAHRDGECGTMAAAAANGMGMVRSYRRAHWACVLLTCSSAQQAVHITSSGVQGYGATSS